METTGQGVLCAVIQQSPNVIVKGREWGGGGKHYQ